MNTNDPQDIATFVPSSMAILPDEMRPEDHIDEGHGIKLIDTEPIDHGYGLWFVCSCGEKWTAAIDFDEMEVAE